MTKMTLPTKEKSIIEYSSTFQFSFYHQHNMETSITLLLLFSFLLRCNIDNHSLHLVHSFNHFHIDINKKNWKKSVVAIATPCLILDPSLVNDTWSTLEHLRDFGPEEERNEREEEEEKKIDEVGLKVEEDEFDIICRSLGLSGPEGYSIPAAAWEAMKARSSSELNNSGGRNEREEEEEKKIDEVGEVANQRGANSLVIIPGSWQKGELLGCGSFGTVYEGISEDGFFFAVKQASLLDQGIRGKQSVVQLEHEIALLSQFEHENIVRYIGTEMDESNLYIFIELLTKGSLLRLYQRYKLQDSQVSAYTRQILHGLKYLHDRNIVHRDIKCANILVDANGSVKVADFGLAKVTILNDVKSCQGTAFWMAPEVVRGEVKGYGLPADIWSLGCTVLEMLTGNVPYFPIECISAMFRIGKGELPPVPDSLSRDARDFILQCLKVNPDYRPTAAQLLDHKFVQRSFSQSFGSTSPHIPRRS